MCSPHGWCDILKDLQDIVLYVPAQQARGAGSAKFRRMTYVLAVGGHPDRKPVEQDGAHLSSDSVPVAPPRARAKEQAPATRQPLLAHVIAEDLRQRILKGD